MEGALESDIALIQAVMNRDGPAIEQVSNTQIESTLNAPAAAGLGTLLVTGHAAPAAQVPGWDPNALNQEVRKIYALGSVHLLSVKPR
jgi:hypothetical protein